MSLLTALTAGLALTASTAQAATVTITSASRNGTNLLVSGASTYDDPAFVEMGTDATEDASTPTIAGQDLTAASLRLRANGQLEFVWTTNGFPPVVQGLPTIMYAWTFCAGEENCYEIDAGRFYQSPSQQSASGILWRCADSSCSFADQTNLSTPVTVTVNEAAKTISARFAATAVGAVSGTVITPVTLSSNGTAFSAVYESYATGRIFPDMGDGVYIETEYTVPGKVVSLAIDQPGLDPATVTYTKDATVASSGAYSAALDVASLAPGPYTVYARACLGEGNCAYGTRNVTI